MYNFRNYRGQHTFSFDDNAVIRLTGESGAGKTNLLIAIQWCLYNYPNIEINPWGLKRAKTWVQLRLKGYLIKRTKIPQLVQVTDNSGVTYEGSVAVGLIEEIFGDRRIFRASSYLPQEGKAYLLSNELSNKEKIEVIENFIFTSTNLPEEILRKVQGTKEKLAKEIEVAEQLFQEYADLKEIYLTSPEEIESLAEEIKRTKEELKEIQSQLLRNQLLTEDIRKIRQQLSRLSLKEKPNLSLEELEKELLASQWKRILFDPLWQDEDIIDGDWTEADFYRFQAEEKKRQAELKLIQPYSCEYTATSISARLEKIADEMEKHRQATLIQQANQIQAEMKLLQTDTPVEVLEKEQKKLEEELFIHQQNQKLLACPSCEQPLQLKRNRLVLSEKVEIDDKKVTAALTSVQRRLKNKIKYEQLAAKYQLLDQQISTDDLTIETDLKQLEKEKRVLERLEIISAKEIHSTDIRKFLQRKKLLESSKKLAPFPNTISVERDVADLEKLIQSQRKQIELFNRQLDQRDYLEKQLQEKLAEIKPNLDERPIKEKLNQSKAQLDLVKRINLAYHEEKKLKELLLRQKRLNQLEEIITKEYYSLIEDELESINFLTNQICRDIFNSPLTIQLCLMKENKKKQTLRSTLHLSIQYQGEVITNLELLSGGEKKRVSIALTMALSLLRNTPFLILDECLNGLNEEVKELVLTSIKTMLKDKLVLCVMHDGIEGYYDRVMKIGQ